MKKVAVAIVLAILAPSVYGQVTVGATLDPSIGGEVRWRVADPVQLQLSLYPELAVSTGAYLRLWRGLQVEASAHVGPTSYRRNVNGEYLEQVEGYQLAGMTSLSYEFLLFDRLVVGGGGVFRAHLLDLGSEDRVLDETDERFRFGVMLFLGWQFGRSE